MSYWIGSLVDNWSCYRKWTRIRNEECYMTLRVLLNCCSIEGGYLHSSWHSCSPPRHPKILLVNTFIPWQLLDQVIYSKNKIFAYLLVETAINCWCITSITFRHCDVQSSIEGGCNSLVLFCFVFLIYLGLIWLVWFLFFSSSCCYHMYAKYLNFLVPSATTLAISTSILEYKKNIYVGWLKRGDPPSSSPCPLQSKEWNLNTTGRWS